MGSEVPTRWDPPGCGNCFLALTKPDHHSAAVTLTGPAPSTLRHTGNLKLSGECKAASAARRPKKELVTCCWYPGAPARLPAARPCLYTSREACRHQSRGERQKQEENDEEKGKERIWKMKSPPKGKEQPGERPEGPRGRGQGGPRHRERTIRPTHQCVDSEPGNHTPTPPGPQRTHPRRDKPEQSSSTKPDH